MKYTVVLRRPIAVLEMLDSDPDFDLYVSNPDKDFPNIAAAVRFARKAVVEADVPEYIGVARERGINIRDADIDPESYELLLVFEGRHEPKFGWSVELAHLNSGV